jgi:hypothetical protein
VDAKEIAMTQNTNIQSAGSGASGHQAHDVADHPHGHGVGCGHESRQHGDHTDYVHDGHRHAEHQGHWDEHGETASGSGSMGSTGAGV